MRDDLLEALHSGRILLADGGMGTALQSRGLELGACPEAWNVTCPERVRSVHAAYVRAGSELILTNTFGGTRCRLALHDHEHDVAAFNQAAVRLAREAAGDEGWVIGDIGPFGGFLAPLGDADPEVVYDAFLEQARALITGGVDAVIVETQLACEEMQLAVAAAREAGAQTVLASFAFDRLPNGTYRTMMGTTPDVACEAMEAAGVDVFGVNCGKDVDITSCIRIVQRYREVTTKPILAKPNAGQPVLSPAGVTYHEEPGDMAAHIGELVDAGASIVGGCCGTTADHIAAFHAGLGRKLRP
ncbi:MAG: homocysteine S-methyltransferase family protein [Planctomycetes bacterium]|nr:homocysteine S-methyltransferase family protein [Planctomycetota bacterium]